MHEKSTAVNELSLAATDARHTYMRFQIESHSMKKFPMCRLFLSLPKDLGWQCMTLRDIRIGHDMKHTCLWKYKHGRNRAILKRSCTFPTLIRDMPNLIVSARRLDWAISKGPLGGTNENDQNPCLPHTHHTLFRISENLCPLSRQIIHTNSLSKTLGGSNTRTSNLRFRYYVNISLYFVHDSGWTTPISNMLARAENEQMLDVKSHGVRHKRILH